MSLFIHRVEEAPRKANFEKLKNNAIEWSEDFKFAKDVVFKGETYTPHTIMEVPSGPADPSNEGIRYGDWGYRHATLPKGSSLYIAQGKLRGWCYFTTDVVMPALYRKTPHNVIMSHTPMEVITQRQGIRFATGRVVIGGLGMGWALDRICKKSSVTEVIVVEQDKELLDWFGRKLCSAQPKVIDVIEDDIFNHLGKLGPDATRYIVDIWNGYGAAAFDKRLREAQYNNPGMKLWCWGENG